MKMSVALERFVMYATIEGKSPRTLELYTRQLGLLCKHLKDPELKRLTTDDLARFLEWLRVGYKPVRIGKEDGPLSDKTRRNYWIALKAFFHWAFDKGYTATNISEGLPAPRFHKAEIVPLTYDQVVAMLDKCRGNRKDRRRARALVVFMLDTGLRVSEVCDLVMSDVDLRTGVVQVRRGKGGKPRVVIMGRTARLAILEYLDVRKDAEQGHAPLFASTRGGKLKRNSVNSIIGNIGRAAGVEVHPHLLRHTFAVRYLINGGDLATLQDFMGHESLASTQIYTAVSKRDKTEQHQRVSPADNWKL